MSTRLAEQWGVPTIALAALFLVLVGLTHLLLSLWVRHQSRPYEAGKGCVGEHACCGGRDFLMRGWRIRRAPSP